MIDVEISLFLRVFFLEAVTAWKSERCSYLRRREKKAVCVPEVVLVLS